VLGTFPTLAGQEGLTVSEAEDWGRNFSGTSMDAYENALVGPLFTPWGVHMLDRVGVREGQSVLDVACGPGTVAQLAAGRVGRSGSVVGCDLSEEMLSIARAKGAVSGVTVEYRQCPADSLSVEDDAFDVAVCQQGLQFFANRVGALRELRRCLRDGGRVGVSVWCEIDACEPFCALAAALAEVFGSEAATAYRNGPWGLSDAHHLTDELSAAGFTDVDVCRDEITVEFEDTDHLIRTLGAAPVGAKVQALGSAGRRALRSAVEQAVAGLISGGVMSGVTTCHTATGTA
jgi:SAM-dependent methyltransferase